MKFRFNKILWLRGTVLAFGISSAMLVFAQSGGGFELDWFTVDGGGDDELSGAGFSLSGTVGQSDAQAIGPMSGGGFTLDGGYWPGVIAQAPDDVFSNGFE